MSAFTTLQHAIKMAKGKLETHWSKPRNVAGKRGAELELARLEKEMRQQMIMRRERYTRYINKVQEQENLVDDQIKGLDPGPRLDALEKRKIELSDEATRDIEQVPEEWWERAGPIKEQPRSTATHAARGPGPEFNKPISEDEMHLGFDIPSVAEIKTPQSPQTMDVWSGSKSAGASNPEFSNLTLRPFVYKGNDYRSVEHAYQSNKSGEFDPNTYEKYFQSNRRKIPGKKQQGDTTALMNELVYESFKQNPEAAKALAATGNARFTHIQDSGHWRNAFPDALHNARSRLGGTERRPVKIVDGTNNTKAAARQGQGTYVMRPNAGDQLPGVDQNNHFGNPWSDRGYQGTIKTDSVPEAVKNYEDWLKGTAHQEVDPARRKWILKKIDEGVFDNSEMLYFKGDIAAMLTC